jgi:hypothetical protein
MISIRQYWRAVLRWDCASGGAKLELDDWRGLGDLDLMKIWPTDEVQEQ